MSQNETIRTSNERGAMRQFLKAKTIKLKPVENGSFSLAIQTIGMSLLSVAFAFLVLGVVLFLIGFDPLYAYKTLLVGAFGNMNSLGATALKVTPLLLIGLGVVIPLKAGVLNIGGEGQLYAGAVAATWSGIALNGLPAIVHLPVSLVLAVAAGALWGFIPGLLKARRGLNEVVTTILMNYLGLYLASWFVHGPLREGLGLYPQTARIAVTAEIPILVPHTQLHAGIILALVCAAATYFFLWRTSFGFEIRTVGGSAKAARFSGVSVSRVIIISMLVGGGLAGLAGGVEVLAIHHRLLDGISPGYGYDAIAVALLGQAHPLGVVLSAFFFGTLLSGSNHMQRVVGVPVGMTFVIEALTVLAVLGSSRFVSRRYKRT